jgi:hypothetical protein
MGNNMKRLSKDEGGLIPLLLAILLAVAFMIYLAYTRVSSAG